MIKKMKRKILALAVVAIASVSILSAQPQGSSDEKCPNKEQACERIAEKLNLTDAQKAKFEKINATFAKETASAKAELKAASEKRQEDILSLLDEEQKAVYLEMQNKREQYKEEWQEGSKERQRQKGKGGKRN